MAKTEIHPDWYPNAKVYCDGQLIMKIGSTKPRLNVDIWSGNHPFYTGSQKNSRYRRTRRTFYA
jgi:large subunit ribosomal protein L31